MIPFVWCNTNERCHNELKLAHLLNSFKEATQDVLAALQVDAKEVTQCILSLKDKARKLICEWLHWHCRVSLSAILATNPVPCKQDCLKEDFLISETLMKADCRDPRWHLLYIDILLARGEVCSNTFSIKLPLCIF